MAIKAKIIKREGTHLDYLYRCVRSKLKKFDNGNNSNIINQMIDCINTEFFWRKRLRAIYNDSITPNDFIVEKELIGLGYPDALNKYRLTELGINLFKFFYSLNYTHIPKEFIIYYDNKTNVIDMKRTIFTLKLGKNKNG